MDNYTSYKNINRGYMKLEVWQKSVTLYQLIWKTLSDIKDLDFKSRSQLVDSVQSISSNIAEGYSRRSINEYLQHLYIALGSLSETLTRIIGLKSINKITKESFGLIDSLHFEIENKMLNLIRSLEKRTKYLAESNFGGISKLWDKEITQTEKEQLIQIIIFHCSIIPLFQLHFNR